MKDFLEKTLRQNVNIEENTDIFEKLPLAFRGRYTIYNIKSNNLSWIGISPKGEVGLVMLRKDRTRVEKETKRNCALFLDHTSFYIKEKLMDEGIPFVIRGKQIYLPFLGYFLADTHERDIQPVHCISFLTQKMLLTAIYERWNEIKISAAAEKLGVSKMSASRCFDELEYLNINVLNMKGKSRVIAVPGNLKQLWNEIHVILRSPVIRKYVLSEDIKLEKKAGISALCEYTLLSDNQYPTYAVTKKELKESGVKDRRQVRITEDIGCVVLELGYFIHFDGKNVEDPFSTALSFTDAEKEDERIRIAIKQMLEEHVWLRD